MTIREAASRLAQQHWQKHYLGPARHGLLRRIARLDARLTTPRLADEFTQMTVTECREFVEKIERSGLGRQTNNR